MGKRVCWLVLYIFCVKMAFGQQWGSTYVLHNRNINSIVLLNPQNITISGGSDYNDAMEAVFHCTDFGLNWNESPADTFGFVVRSLAFSDTMHGFGSGFFGNFVRTSDGGVTWPRDTLPIKRNFFKAIYATPTKAFLAGGEELGANMQTILMVFMRRLMTMIITAWLIVRLLFPWLKACKNNSK